MSRAKGEPKPKRSFGDIFAKYKTYDPSVEGYGDSEEWRECFYERMGFEEAQEILSGQTETPRSILGVGPKASWDEIKKAFRAKIRQWHPDFNPGDKHAEEVTKKLIAAYTLLEKQLGL